jgi:hypothetical protein
LASRNQPRRPCAVGKLRRQLVAARLAVELILRGVDRPGLLDDLARELLVVEILVARRVGLHLRAVNGDHADLDQPAARAQREHLAEQPGDRLLMALHEPRQRRVVRALLGRQHAERDVFLTRALDHARGPDPARVGVKQQRDHHRRVIRRPAAPVDAVGGIERLKVHLSDRVDDKPRQMPRRQPLTDVGRHQKRLLAITSNKALAHHEMVLNPPDDTPTYATASPGCSRLRRRPRDACSGRAGVASPSRPLPRTTPEQKPVGSASRAKSTVRLVDRPFLLIG